MDKKRNWFGLSTEKDGSYAYLMVASSAWISTFIYGYNVTCSLLTATWKTSLGLEFETASIHQTLQLTCRYLSTILTSLFLDRLSTSTWVLITVICMMACYATVFIGSFFVDYFIFFQIVYGVLNGFGVGIGYTLCIVTPQAWLDQKRAQLNGFILIGAPLGAFGFSMLWPWMVNMFTWSGALLISIGIVSNILIVWPIFESHPEIKLERKKIRIYNPELGKLPGVKVFILFNIVIGAFVITPFLSIYSNVVTEFGVTTQQVSYLMMICTATEVSGRFIWGIIAKYVELSKCAILWSVGLFGCMTWISMSSSFTQFAIGQLVSGFFLAGFGSHKHALTVELVGLKLQPDCIIIDNALTCPLSFLIPLLFIKIGAYYKNPGIGFKIAALFCFINIGLAIYLHKLIHEIRTRKASESDKERYTSECVSDSALKLN